MEMPKQEMAQLYLIPCDSLAPATIPAANTLTTAINFNHGLHNGSRDPIVDFGRHDIFLAVMDGTEYSRRRSPGGMGSTRECIKAEVE